MINSARFTNKLIQYILAHLEKIVFKNKNKINIKLNLYLFIYSFV